MQFSFNVAAISDNIYHLSMCEMTKTYEQSVEDFARAVLLSEMYYFTIEERILAAQYLEEVCQ